jgi:Adenylate and Guanylate cyclase catalytic domain
MFCDLVGSTALSARVDPEDMREIVGSYHRSCAEQITKAGGFVVSSPSIWGMGCWLILGYPQAHEHDAERAVLAGLALVEAWSATSLDRERRRNVAFSVCRGVPDEYQLGGRRPAPTSKSTRHGQPNTKSGGLTCMRHRARRVSFSELGSVSPHPINRGTAATNANATQMPSL